jgi:hypothetical protein
MIHVFIIKLKNDINFDQVFFFYKRAIRHETYNMS